MVGPAEFNEKGDGVRIQLRWAGTLTAAMIAAAVAAGCSLGGPRASKLQIPPSEAYQEARRTVLQASGDRAGEVRSRAMEVLALTEGADAADVFVSGLRDPEVGVRFAAVMALGDCGYAPAAEVLRQMMANEQTNPNVRGAIIYALDRMGDRRFRSKLGMLLTDASPEVRANAALVIAKIGDPAGTGPLRDRLEGEQHAGVKYQLTESLAALGYPLSVGMLSGYIRMGQPHEKLLALQALGRTGSPRAQKTLIRVLDEERPPLVRIAAAGALGRLGDARGYKLALQAVVDPDALARQSYGRPVRLGDPQRYQIQMLGALALGQMRREEAAGSLMGLLASPERSLAVAAAKSIMVLLAKFRPPMTAGGGPPTPTDPTATRPTTTRAATQPTTTQPTTTRSTKPPSLHSAPPKD